MKRLFAALACTTLCACAAVTPETYEGHAPEYDIRQYLNGTIEANGVFIGRDNLADPIVHVKMRGKWDGGDGTLEEWFTYSDGKKSRRTWNIHFTDEHHFTAAAEDVVGDAEGAQYGNAVNMQYTLLVEGHEMSMNDWMYLVDPHTVINRTTMSKLGVQFGEIVLSFHKP